MKGDKGVKYATKTKKDDSHILYGVHKSLTCFITHDFEIY